MTAGTIDAAALLKELEGAWTQVGRQTGGEGVLRACTMTLIALHPAGALPGGFAATMAGVQQSHPARTVVIEVPPAPAQALHSRVSVECWIAFGQRRHVCSETVEITCGEDSLDTVAPVVAGLLAPDLPVVLWASGEKLFQNAGFFRLASLAGKLIVDTRPLGPARKTLSRLHEFATRPRAPQVADLAWASVTPWRAQLAQLFADSERLARCPAAREVTFEYAGDAPPVEVWYLAAWLANCLGWRLHGSTIETQRGAAPLRLLPRDGPPQARLLAMSLHGWDWDIALRLHPEEALEIISDGLCKSVPFPPQSAGTLLSEELSILGEDRAFRLALERAWPAVQEQPHQ